MPDRTQLRIGDRIRILRVPDGDIEQRERERAAGLPDAGWTADTFERLIRADPRVTIDRVDEYGYPWFDCEVRGPDGALEEHSLAVMDDDSWERA